MKTFEVRFTNLLFYSAILIFFSAFNLSDAPPPSGWYQQFMPDLGGKQLNDITFLDSLTGFAIASRNINPDTSSILKTTNGGNNWQIIFTQAEAGVALHIYIKLQMGEVTGLFKVLLDVHFGMICLY